MNPNEVFSVLWTIGVWLSRNYGEILLSIRLALHLITIGYLLAYTSSQRSRFTPTVLAIVIGGCSAAAVFQIFTEWPTLKYTTQPWIMGLVFSLAVICAKSKGNMSRPLRFFYR